MIESVFKICFLFSIGLFSIIVQAQDKLYTNTFPLSDVKLLDGPFKHARDLNIEVLLKYDLDRPEWGEGYVGGAPNSKNIWSLLKKGDFGLYRGPEIQQVQFMVSEY